MPDPLSNSPPEDDPGRVPADLEATVEAAAAGDPAASRELLPIIYDELKKIARARLAHLPPGQTLQTTALVHEVYLRLTRNDKTWHGRTHFLRVASRAMRSILVDQARRKGAQKRGRDHQRVPLEQVGLEVKAAPEDILAVDEALHVLSDLNSEAESVVQLRYFAGLETAEIADVLELSVATVERRWRFARAWLQRRLETGAS